MVTNEEVVKVLREIGEYLDMQEVPFKPRGDRPIYCKDCYIKRKDSGR